jgi:tagatose 1,6-diphosphate aldolase/sulfofructosephosphate aldolase
MTAETKNAKTLADIASNDGVFAIIAMDQRNTLRRMFKAVDIEASDHDLRVAKADVARALTPAATGILLDPTYGVPAVTETQALAPDCGLLVAAEPSIRNSYNGEPRTHRDPELNAHWVAAQGGDAVKFLVQLRTDRPSPKAGEADLVAEVLNVCRDIVADCKSTGLPSVIENLVYELPGEKLSDKARGNAIIEAARSLDEIDIDLLKLEYPGSPAACRRLADALHRPWAVLSAGVPFETFSDVLKIAFDEGGASGFIAGRSIWRETLPLSGVERQRFLDTVARPRLDDLVTVANQRAHPWTEATR